MRILLVDDQAAMRTLIRSGLRRVGLTNVSEAEHGRGALAWLGQDSFDLIIADRDMPVMDGLCLLKTVRADPRTARTPFILLCGGARTGEVAEAKALGVDGVVAKPFSIAQLARRIEPILIALAESPAPPPAAAQA